MSSPDVPGTAPVHADVIDDLVEALTARLACVSVALGGSRARGGHAADSDVDLHVYYDHGDACTSYDRLVAGLHDGPLPPVSTGCC